MAYSPINNNKFDSGDVIIGADIAQLNDNIEDTRTLTVNQYATVYEWSSHSEVGQTVADNSGNDATFTFETPTTTTYYGSKEFDFLTSSGLIDTAGTVFGDEIKLRLYIDYDLSSGLPTDTTNYQLDDFDIKVTFADGTEKISSIRTQTSSIFSDTNNPWTGSAFVDLFFSAGLDFATKIGQIQSIAVMDQPGVILGTANSFDVIEKITPTKLEINVNVG